MDARHDQAFLQILSEEKNITNFLDAFFGFLCRCTDFYVESSVEQKLGFPPGVAEKLTIDCFQKWKSLSPQSANVLDPQTSTNSYEIVGKSPVACVANEVEIDGEENNEYVKILKPVEQPSDSYNGAVRDNYTWSQTIGDLDVIVKIPECIKNIKALKVDINFHEIKIAAKSSSLKESFDIDSVAQEWTSLLEGRFRFKIRKDESIWSFVSGRHINIHLEKAVERWWDALLEGEAKIDLDKINCSRNLDELGDAEQMKVEELMWNHQQRLLNKPTSEQTKMENILKKAWNVEGSPFKGIDYDPSVVKFN